MKKSVSLSHEPYFKCASIVHVWWLPLWTAQIDNDFITRRKFYQTVLISRLRNSEWFQNTVFLNDLPLLFFPFKKNLNINGQRKLRKHCYSLCINPHYTLMIFVFEKLTHIIHHHYVKMANLKLQKGAVLTWLMPNRVRLMCSNMFPVWLRLSGVP